MFAISSFSFAVSPSEKYPLTYLDVLVNRTAANIQRLPKPAKVFVTFVGHRKPLTLLVEVQFEGELGASEKMEIESFYSKIIEEEASDLSVTGTKIVFEFQNRSNAPK